MSHTVEFSRNGLEIAIIGMAGRFPGAKNIEEFWQNLRNGVESITTFTNEELIADGIDPDLLNNPNYVKAGAVLEDIELFDAEFFGFNPREAEIIDPQHRLFLECAWEAMENAGYNSKMYSGLIGVYAGAGSNNYVLNIYSNQNIRSSIDRNQLFFGNDKDFLATRVSYKLDLEGPAVGIQTACSTSLVAVHLACRGLLSGECDIALAGGVAIDVPQKEGYLYQEGGIVSPDGRCRAFDAKAQGTVFSNGVGIVVLKRLEDAIADGDCIYAVIKGSAINNDGAFKVSYTAPRIDGQAKVIRAAQVMAEVDPETITYIEAHGTGTSLGDPIEISALTQVFRASTDKKGFCAVGSVKTNIGHSDITAGVAGLIKTVLALKHKQIPPSLHFQQPNPEIDFDNSPFYVNTTLSDWQTNGTPRRAGVSSFGIGGTNAHVVLEEAPVVETRGGASLHSRPWHLLLLSAKTRTALETATANLAAYLQQHPDLNLADVAYTLQVGRQAFEHRFMVVCQNLEDAVKKLEFANQEQGSTYLKELHSRPVVLMFPGQGAQYINMGRELYRTEPIFREEVNRCCELLKPHLGIDLRHILYPSEEQIEAATHQLQQTHITQPALFVIEYALSQLWMAWGIQPEAMIGHSIGEYVAACLAGVFSLEDALTLVAVRGRLMQELPTGAMLSVHLAEDDLRPWLGKEVSLAASNAPNLCVVSGSEEAIAHLQSRLTDQGVECRRLHTSHAFHSPMMDSILESFTNQVEKIKLNPPQISFISNLTGTWITAKEATDPTYWAKHLRQTVRFAQGMAELMTQSERILLEVGPGMTLSTFARQSKADEPTVLATLRHPKYQKSDSVFLLTTIGQLWLAGVQVDWYKFNAQQSRQRIPLPTYPFERQRYWIEAQKVDNSHPQIKLTRKPNMADWFYVPAWKRVMLLEPWKTEGLTQQKSCWLVFVDPCGVGSQIAKRLEQQGQDVIKVTIGEEFTKLSDFIYTINPQQQDDYKALMQALREIGKTPQNIAHFWGVTANTTSESSILHSKTQLGIEDFCKSQDLVFYSLLFLAQQLTKHHLTTPVQIIAVTNNMHEVVGQEQLQPEKATVLGPCKAIAQEYPHMSCRSVDIVIPESETFLEKQLIDQLIAELTQQPSDLVVAYRNGHRWVQTFEPIQLNEVVPEKTRLREGGIYLIVGDPVKGLGLVFAEYLAQTVHAKLILIENSELPEKNDWGQWLATHDQHNNISDQIRRIQALEELSGDVLIIKADVANEEQMQQAMTIAYEHFGQIHGVFYVPEISGNEKSTLSIHEIGRTECEQEFNSKVHGLFVLEKVLQGKKLDFYLLQSSLSSILGGLGLVAYAAAYLFMDAFVHQKNQQNSVPWFSVNRQAFISDLEKEEYVSLGSTATELFMTPQEVWEAFQRILSMGAANQVVVSTGDLQARINQSLKIKPLETVSNSKNSQQADSFSQHSRPNLETVYVAPRNEIEQTIANIWQEILGVSLVGVNDDFFELGGHSLLAVQVTSRLRETFQVDLPLNSILFEASTVAGLAAVIAQQQPQQEELEEMVALLQEVKSLSAEEVQAEMVKDFWSS
ncbi:type I polyketide synthase [Fischerella thermalis]|uniref:type I polyketide synthase n=1 Tax=Fischerella thermalis TaxID=372787 RepID=UPI00307F3E75